MQGGPTRFTWHSLWLPNSWFPTFMFWRHQATLREESLHRLFLRITWFYPVMPFFISDGLIFRRGSATQLPAVSEKSSLPFHLPTLSIPVMAWNFYWSREMFNPSLDNPKRVPYHPLLSSHKVDKKAGANLLFYYILRKRLMEVKNQSPQSKFLIGATDHDEEYQKR